LAVAAAVAAVVTVLSASAGATRSGDDAAALGPGLATVGLGIEHSAFSRQHVRVRAGTTIQFIVRNGDPIVHELIVGDDAVHARHATGREAAHPPVPGEVSVAPGDTAVTTYRFDQPGTVVFACHLPGHLEYGMQGTIEVDD
jgi:uncharacterized cupredoxin-like copper-binding protein